MFKIGVREYGLLEDVYPSYEAAVDALENDPDYTEGDMTVWIEEVSC